MINRRWVHLSFVNRPHSGLHLSEAEFREAVEAEEMIHIGTLPEQLGGAELFVVTGDADWGGAHVPQGSVLETCDSERATSSH
jgi:hypothetical protein